METVRSYDINGIDYGHLSRLVEDRAKYPQRGNWDDYLTSLLCSLNESKSEIIQSSIGTCRYLNRGSPTLGYDHPTDIIWSLSILFVFRTLAMLESKFRHTMRCKINREAHQKIQNTYIDLLKCLIENKEKLAD